MYLNITSITYRRRCSDKPTNMTTKNSLLIISLLLININLNQQQVFASESEEQISPLFASNEPLKFTLIIDTKKLKSDESDDPEYTEGQLILDTDGVEKTFDIKARARGNSRRIGHFCTFPPIKLNFQKKSVTGTVFEGQDKLKLVAYCKDLDLNEAYVLKEYLPYKFLNCLTPYSFKVRLAEITYKDINDKGKDVTRYGFLIEDDDIMAARNGGQITEMLMSNHDRCERNALDIFTVFQYMIGNTDWWIAKPKIHNVKLVLLEGGNVVPVPYDFDYCGIVDAKYAVTDEQLPIDNVKQRFFRGYCRFPGTYELVIDKFNENKDCIYTEINNLTELDEKYRKIIIKYIDDFYETVNDPKQLKRRIYDMCEINHTHLHVVKKNK